MPEMPELKASEVGPRSLGMPRVNLDPKKLQAALDDAMSAGLLRTTSGAGPLTYLFPFELWAFQKKYGDALVDESHEWLTSQKLLALMPRQQYPHYVMTAASCQRAILDTITIDLLRKVKYRLCKREDCKAPFKLKSRKLYCCWDCAHIEAVRDQRRRAKQSKGKE